MKVSIVHGFVGGGGGTERTLNATLEALIEHKFNIELYTVSKPSIEIDHSVKVHRLLPFKLPFFALYQRYLESKLSKKTNSNLVLHTSGGFAVPENNKQIIIYCHHDFKNEVNKSGTKYKGIWSWYYRPYYLLMRKFLNNIKNENIHLISNSKFVCESIKKQFGKNSTIIYPPVDLNEFHIGNNKNRNLITVSRFSTEKNLEFAIKATTDIDANYVIIGNTKTRANEIYFERLKMKCQQSSANIVLLKNVERSQVIRHINQSKVYFHTSPETFGISVVESIAGGCIPIVPDNTGHQETVPFPELRYDPNNPSQAREKIEKALAGEFDYLSKQLLNHIKNFSKEKFKISLIQYLEKLRPKEVLRI